MRLYNIYDVLQAIKCLLFVQEIVMIITEIENNNAIIDKLRNYAKFTILILIFYAKNDIIALRFYANGGNTLC